MFDIDPLAPDLIAIRDLPRLLPHRRGGRKLNLSTVWRWATHGYGPERVRLPVLRIGSNVYTTRTALREWCARLTPSASAPEPPPCAPRRRQRGCDRAAEQLEKLGI